MSTGHTPDRILDVAERLVQTRGFNGFSYADLASALKIRKPSVHHHFATKAELGRRLITRYTARFGDALDALERKHATAPRRLAGYAALFAAVLRDEHRLCLCGMLAAELATLPPEMVEGIRAFFVLNERWLACVLDAGRRRGELAFRGSPTAHAGRLVSAFEGAMLVARAHGEPARFDAQAKAILANLRLGR